MAVLDLLDYRRRVSEIYRRVRATPDPVTAWERWVEDRQLLFGSHPQSPWEPLERSERTLDYFPYDPAWRVVVEVRPVDGPARSLDHSTNGTTAASPLGNVTFGVEEQHHLTVYWLGGYGGGLFLPFRDQTNGSDTYGGGRYLLDTAKGADLGGTAESLVLDFNFAYHPSCVHSHRWSCPLAPAENWLDVAVTAGERLA